MHDTVCDDILIQQGFRRIGSLQYRVDLSIWWRSDVKIQLIVLSVGSVTLLKGFKSYYLKSITEEGETWARDVRQLHDYLEAHFSEIHMCFSHFRDASKTLAAAHLRKRRDVLSPSVPGPTIQELASLQNQIRTLQNQAAGVDTMLVQDAGSDDLAHGHLLREQRQLRGRVEELQREQARQTERGRLFDNLQSEYQRKGTACCLAFSVQANLQETTCPEELIDAVSAISKELADIDRYQIHQKLSGGKLNIQIAEAEEPLLVWLEEWLGGAMSPRQLERLSPSFTSIRNAAELRMMLYPDQDVEVNDSVREPRKLMSARTISSMLSRLDRTDHSAHLDLNDLADTAMPIQVGLFVRHGRQTQDPATLPLRPMGHCYLSGMTGSGKSYAGRVLVEEAVARGVNVLVLDPRNQAVGLLVPEDRTEILNLYPAFGMDLASPRGFDFRYYSPGQGIGKCLPADLGDLAHGRHIVSFKGMSDYDRCLRFKEILNAVFERVAGEEATTTELIIVVEEAQRFTRKRVDDKAKSAGAAAENALDRTVREGRKYGSAVMILSQTIRDFAYDSASIRQNTNTKVFLHNSDREIDYANDFMDDGRAIVRLPPATAIFCNAAWGSVTIRIRPPLSKVWEFSAEATRVLVDVESGCAFRRTISTEASSLLEAVRNHFDRTQVGLNLSQAADQIGLTSKRKLQHLVEELEQARLVASKRLPERGKPRILEPILSTRPHRIADTMRTESGRKR